MKLLSAQVKICQFPCVNFETTNRFLSKFCIPLQFHERDLLRTFLSLNNIYSSQKKPIKVKISETLECSGQNLSNSWCQLWNEVDSSPNFPSLFSFMKDNSYVHFQLEQYILCSKEAHWSERIWTFQVLRWKFLKFLMSILKPQVVSTPNFVSLFSFMKDKSYVLF